jgi:hypothetical protein
MNSNFLKRLFACLLIFGLTLQASAKNTCLEEGRQSAACRGIHAYFFAKYKMDAAARSGHKMLTLSCDLRNTLQQCREYRLLANASESLAEMKEGCQSMGGKFSNEICPDSDIVGACNNLVRNYHQPDVIYNNVYYQSNKKSETVWIPDSIKQVCSDLGGVLFVQKN